MAAITNGRITVIVPDDAVDDYLSRGYRHTSDPAPASTPTRRRSSATSSRTRGARSRATTPPRSDPTPPAAA
ncbi:MAG TPA: hypothetical protein VIL55_08680 [Naasia sp.]|jgi:hypothetical protein